jgi:hypothetical protein
MLLSAILLTPLLGNSLAHANDASIYFLPSTGQYTVGSTIDVSIVINTGSHSINALDARIAFPKDKLQVVSPSVGSSFVTIWTSPPSYSNTSGTLNFSGGLPNPGIKSSAAILATIRFRVKSSGNAVLRFRDNTQLLANDGNGTNVLSSKTQAILTLITAAPNGPAVTSSSHPDQNTWYNDKSASFSWEAVTGASGYSWVVDTSAKTVPEEKIRTTATSASETVTQDGIWYFHIRANNGSWGGTTHFLFRVDSLGPAAFTPTLNKRVVEDGESAIVSFFTTDAASGIDHYEIKTINTSKNDETVTIFHEETSPYELPVLPDGQYTVIVRAYDVAGNYTDGMVELRVEKNIFPVITALKRIFGDPAGNVWALVNLIGVAILIALIMIWALRKHRQKVQQALITPSPNQLAGPPAAYPVVPPPSNEVPQ